MTLKDSYDVMVFSAHPDDSEMGMAGTSIRLTDAGYSLLSICLTKGEMGTYGDPETRSKEYQEASRIIGADCLQFDYPDTEVENDAASRKHIASIIRQYKPKIIFAPYHTNPLGEPGGLAHRDHFTTGALVRDAIKLARLEKTNSQIPKHNIHHLYFYMVPRTVWTPLIVDVTGVMERAMEAVRAYKTQMNIKRQELAIHDMLHIRRAAIGQTISVRYAESFATDVPLKMEPKDFLAL